MTTIGDSIVRIYHTMQKRWFLFEELVKRDFKEKYKRTVLGMGWSLLSPLLTLLVMKLVFTQFFGRTMLHYTIYLFSGNIVLAWFKESTKHGMSSLLHNAKIFTKINVPKYLFLFSKNVSSAVNFALTLVVYFIFCILDGISFGPHMLMLIYPVMCLLAFNLGMGLVLSAMFVLFRDVKYLYDVFLTLLTYLSAVFYTVNSFPPFVQKLFLLNPVYCYIKYFRVVVIDGNIPSLAFHVLCASYATALLLIGGVIYKKYNHKFLYYV